MIRNRAQVQEYLLNKLKKSSEDVLDVALVTGDGFILVSTSQNEAFRDRIAAVAASVFKPSKKASEELNIDGMSFVVISGTGSSLYIREIDQEQILAVMVKAGARWTSVQKEISRASDDLAYVSKVENIEDRLSH